jgi:hypothetical protein
MVLLLDIRPVLGAGAPQSSIDIACAGFLFAAHLFLLPLRREASLEVARITSDDGL